MALHLREQGIAYEAVFCDTGWEHPDTYTYLRDVLDPAIGPIRWLRSPEGGMVEWIRRKVMFPSRMRRWCTERLKVLPIREYPIRRIEETGGTVVNAVGIRRLESAARAQLPEWERWAADQRGGIDCMIWRPLIGWTEEQVIEIHRRHGIAPNPLYLRGANRVGCWPCIHARKAEIALVARDDPERIDMIRALEIEMTAGARARSTARAEKPWPEKIAGDEELEDLERELRDPASPRHERCYFQGPARNGVMSIDDVVAWAQTDRGGRQMPMFDLLDNAATDGCMRWGMCETDDGGDV